ncbi:hypothetical protein V8F33_004599 [Rhypophila sp. PSN 637]
MSESVYDPRVKHRRRRPAVSCTLCRKRKIRCNRDSPCSNCVRSKNPTCVYDASVQLPPRHSPDSPSQLLLPSSLGGRSRSNSSIHSETSPGSTSHANSLQLLSSNSSSNRDFELEKLRTKVRQLEHQKSLPTQSESSLLVAVKQSTETTTSELAGTFHVQHESRPNDQPSRSRIVHDTRVFGQSHWSNGIIQFRDIFQAMEPNLRQQPSQAAASLRKCESLGRFIKTQRLPPWPTPLTSDSIPERNIADQLVECYLQSTETVYRILHIPTFQKEYESVWKSEYNNDTERARAIQVQLKLVLAIGAVSYDESFSLRPSALGWVYEAETWAAEPNMKLRDNMRYIQNSILLLIARELAGVGGDLMWVSAGSLVRTAMYMGLHRDPARLPNRSSLDGEMHRRLWNTILELSLSASMSSGGPVLISLGDFDTVPPGNFDDDQLIIPAGSNGGAGPDQAGHHQQRPLPRLEGTWTETSVAIALRHAYPLRLAIAKILNDLSASGTYEETLKLDAELRSTYKVLCQTLQSCQESSKTSGGKAGLSQFASCWVDFHMQRFLLALHSPFFGPGLKETTYAFSRKVVVETSVKIWRAVYPGVARSSASQISMDITSPPDQNDSNRQEVNLLARLAICGSGSIRTVPLLAAVSIATELRTQLQEESTSLGPVSIRPDLLAVVHDAKAWTRKCLSVGETNVKAAMLYSLIAAQIDGLIQGLGKEDLAQFLVKASEKAGSEVLAILEQTAAGFSREGYSAGISSGISGVGTGSVDMNGAVGALYLDEMSLGSDVNGHSGGFMEGWDFMVSLAWACGHDSAPITSSSHHVRMTANSDQLVPHARNHIWRRRCCRRRRNDASGAYHGLDVSPGNAALINLDYRPQSPSTDNELHSLSHVSHH